MSATFPKTIFVEDLETVIECDMCGPVNVDGIVPLSTPCHPDAPLNVAIWLAGQTVEVSCSECDAVIASFAIARRG